MFKSSPSKRRLQPLRALFLLPLPLYDEIIILLIVSLQKKVKLSTRLSKCINYVQSVHFKGFDDWGEAGKPLLN